MLEAKKGPKSRLLGILNLSIQNFILVFPTNPLQHLVYFIAAYVLGLLKKVLNDLVEYYSNLIFTELSKRQIFMDLFA